MGIDKGIVVEKRNILLIFNAYESLGLSKS
jgi:hypothetical protein